MQENDEKRIERTVVWLDAKLIPRMDGWLAADNCKNRSEFINKALRFYMGYLGTEDNTAYLSQAILTAIQGTLDDNNNALPHSFQVRGGAEYAVPHHRRPLPYRSHPHAGAAGLRRG